MGTMAGKVLGLVIILVLLAVVGGMAMLGTSGSLVIYNILTSLAQWSGLIALGVSLGLFFWFLPSLKGRKF